MVWRSIVICVWRLEPCLAGSDKYAAALQRTVFSNGSTVAWRNMVLLDRKLVAASKRVPIVSSRKIVCGVAKPTKSTNQPTNQSTNQVNQSTNQQASKRLEETYASLLQQKAAQMSLARTWVARACIPCAAMSSSRNVRRTSVTLPDCSRTCMSS
jgi:hypothetical protein